MKQEISMVARLVLATVLATLGFAVAAQSRLDIQKHGDVDLLEISSAELPRLLELVRKRTVIGFADKWVMPSEVLTQDVVIANEIVFEKGKRLLLSPRAINDDNLILFIGQTIRIKDPLVMIWDRNIAGQIRDPIRFGKAAPGAPGEREGAPGRRGFDGIAGSRGLKGREGPGVIFIAYKLDISAPVRLVLNGQDGGPGGGGQDGGDGGAGRPGRPGLLAASGIGVSIKQMSVCAEPIHGGDGGDGGRGGDGGEGGSGGDGGSVGFISSDVSLALMRKVIDPKSSLQPGKNGSRGLRGLGGKGGPGAPGVLAQAPCAASNPGKDGKQGDGHDPRADPAPAVPDRTDGEVGPVVFSRLNDSQARSIGVLSPPQK